MAFLRSAGRRHIKNRAAVMIHLGRIQLDKYNWLHRGFDSPEASVQVPYNETGEPQHPRCKLNPLYPIQGDSGDW